ncbi:tail fiber domain-containing protein [Halobacteriales archaeon Cl-PHB]
MPQTPNHGYNVPNEGAQDWHKPLNENFEAYDTDIEVRDTDGNTGTYTPKQGAKYLATDTGRVYEGDGSNWNATLAQYRYSAPSASGAAGNLVAGHPTNSVGSGVSAATIAGGGTSSSPNQVTASAGTVGGGEGNVAGGNYATVGGGDANEASGAHATVAGGQNNEATGQHSTVLGGYGNSATAPNAFAAGTNASADHEGAFIWSDTSSGGLSSLNPNEFAVSAAGGVFFFSNSGATTGVELTSGSGSWSSASSRALKSNVDPVDPVDVLDRVRDLDVSTWNYDAEGEDVRHMGPMAEEFAAAFGLGDDEGQISNVDADGVALAAIQGLSERLDEKDAKLDRQRDRIDDLEAENDALRSRLAAVEAAVGLGGAPDRDASTAD